MVLSDFIVRADQIMISNAIKNKKPFQFEKTVKSKCDKVTLNYHSTTVDEKLANDIWDGIRYLVHISISYNGKSNGFGGYGFATNKYDRFMDWNSFADFTNGLLITFSDYKRNEIPDQLSLFY